MAALSARSKRVWSTALCDPGALTETVALLNSTAGSLPQADLGTTSIPTFGGVKVGANQVLGARQTAVTPVAFSATTGSLPTAGGTTVFSDTSTPTVVELLDAVVELRANVVALQAVLHAHGLTT